MAEEPLSFTLDWLAEAAHSKKPLTVCAAGHLVVRDRTCWQPLHFSPDLRSLWCQPVEHPDKTSET